MADTAFSSGGDKSGAKRPKKFFCPPLSSSGGDRGGDSLALLQFKKISRKKYLSPPPESLRGGDILAVPRPLNCSGGGQFSGGGTVPYSHPLYSLLYVVIYKQIQSNLSRISLKGKVQAKLLLKFVKIHQKWSEFWLNYSRSNFSI